MNIIPYGHSGVALYRVPWATIVIFVVCGVAFVLTNGASDRAREASQSLYEQIIESYLADPTLEIDPRILESFLRFKDVDENEREVYLEMLAEWSAANPNPEAARTQEEIDRLTEQYWTVRRSSPSYRFGLVPAAQTPLSHLTHIFMHQSWGHLIGNMLFLFLTAPYLEQRWGWPLFVGFYLAAGFVPGVLWVARHPGIEIASIGASGAIAGLMGAFLICFAAAKIRFAYWFLIVWGAFELPAWLVLPLWLGKEIIAARQKDVFFQYAAVGGVGHWTHVWGFIFGMAFAWGLSLAGLDRHLGDVVADEPLVVAPAGGLPGDSRWLEASAVPASAAVAVSALDQEAARRRDSWLDEAPPDLGVLDIGVGPPPVVNEREVGRRSIERLHVVEGLPKALGESVLRFAVGDAVRTLDLGRVEAVAVGAIERPGGRPFVVVDLLLDSPWEDESLLRVVRLRSSSFDPRALVDGEGAIEAFTRLLDRLLAASSAVPLPDAEHLRSPGTTVYASLEQYEREVLGVVGELERSVPA